MSEKKQITKPRAISGFPEWLPEVRLVEQKWLDHIRSVFERYGYCSIETPAVEELAIISAKGEDVDKEIYVLERLQADPDEKKDARLALHFDQTVPLARYVAQNFNELVFPFKRYQMQKVWRGERPQMGRMREFTQCDIDVIGVDTLPLSFDAEVASVMYEVVSGLAQFCGSPSCHSEPPFCHSERSEESPQTKADPSATPQDDKKKGLGRVQLRISNRKILMGLLHAYGITNTEKYTRLIDKLEKIGESELKTVLEINLWEDDFSKEFAVSIVEFAKLKAIPLNFSGLLRDFIARNDVIVRSVSDAAIQTLNEGIKELSFILDSLSHLPEGAVVADLSIVRGLDYYTGTVYETQLLDVPEFTGSVCSGGRYDDLAGSYINKHLPGVGISLGFSRLFDVMRQTGRLKIGAKCPTHILVLLFEESQSKAAHAKARDLRAQGINVEVYHAPSNPKKQFAYAERKGIPFTYIPMDNDGARWEIKDMTAHAQMSEEEGLSVIKERLG